MGKSRKLKNDEPDFERYTAALGCLSGPLEMVGLLAPTSDLEAIDINGHTALFHAVEAQQAGLEILELLLFRGAKHTHVDKNKRTALRYAAELKKPDVAKALMKFNSLLLWDVIRDYAPGDKDGGKVNLQAALTLIDYGADINGSLGNDTLMHLAARKGCTVILERFQSIPAIRSICLIDENNDITTLQRSQSIRQLGDEYNTPLHEATKYGWIDTVQYILESMGGDIDVTGHYGWTPLHTAAAYGQTDIAALLLSKGASTEALSDIGFNPAYLACRGGNDETAAVILGAMIQARIFAVDNISDDTLIRVASVHGCSRAVRHILEVAQATDRIRTVVAELDQGCSLAFDAIKNQYEETSMALLEMAQASRAWTNGATMPIILLFSMASPMSCATFYLATKRRRLEQLQQNTQAWGLSSLYFCARKIQNESVTKTPMAGRFCTGRLGVPSVSLEIVEWLTPEDSRMIKSAPLELSQPICNEDAKQICNTMKSRIMDIYSGGETLEKSGFSMLRCLYDYGPREIMSAVASTHERRGRLKIRWIRLPANNLGIDAFGDPRWNNCIILTNFTEGLVEDSFSDVHVRGTLSRDASVGREASRQSSDRNMFEHYSRERKDNVHIPLTLDQSYYHAVGDTDDRNTDQVIFRHQARTTGLTNEKRFICMTPYSGPRESIDLRKEITEHVTQRKEGQNRITSVYAMVALAVAAAVRKTFEWEIGDGRERLLPQFGSAVATAANTGVKLFNEFTDSLAAPDRTPGGDGMNTRLEVELLREIKDIEDELQLIMGVFRTQSELLNRTFDFLEGEFASQRDPKSRHIMEFVNSYEHPMRSQFKYLEKLIRESKMVHDNVNHLDLKQKDANLSEAIWARKASESATSQGRIIMVFTTVTIIFVSTFKHNSLILLVNYD
ncbi:hypothetical protein PG994_008001 [Apiospora phragmitis]|uniref:Ankyrin repeat protein n=1 Tax=Apiospora phragmitis TaxID=2905665 RepID=A0ABR1URU3_9PEZI